MDIPRSSSAPSTLTSIKNFFWKSKSNEPSPANGRRKGKSWLNNARVDGEKKESRGRRYSLIEMNVFKRRPPESSRKNNASLGWNSPDYNLIVYDPYNPEKVLGGTIEKLLEWILVLLPQMETTRSETNGNYEETQESTLLKEQRWNKLSSAILFGYRPFCSADRFFDAVCLIDKVYSSGRATPEQVKQLKTRILRLLGSWVTSWAKDVNHKLFKQIADFEVELCKATKEENSYLIKMSNPLKHIGNYKNGKAFSLSPSKMSSVKANENSSVGNSVQAEIIFSIPPSIPKSKLSISHQAYRKCCRRLHTFINKFSRTEITVALATLTKEHMQAVSYYDFRKKFWGRKKREKKSKCPLDGLANRNNQISRWAISTILSADSIKQQVKLFGKFVKIASLLYEMNDFESLSQLVYGLDDNRLTNRRRAENHFFNQVPTDIVNLFKKLLVLVSPGYNFSNYRRRTQKLAANNIGYLPLFAVFLRDLTVSAETLPNYLPVQENSNPQTSQTPQASNEAGVTTTTAATTTTTTANTTTTTTTSSSGSTIEHRSSHNTSNTTASEIKLINFEKIETLHSTIFDQFAQINNYSFPTSLLSTSNVDERHLIQARAFLMDPPTLDDQQLDKITNPNGFSSPSNEDIPSFSPLPSPRARSGSQIYPTFSTPDTHSCAINGDELSGAVDVMTCPINLPEFSMDSSPRMSESAIDCNPSEDTFPFPEQSGQNDVGETEKPSL